MTGVQTCALPISGGSASAVVTLGAGSHSLTAAYTPDAAGFEASVSAPVVIDVAPSSSTTTLRLSRSLGSYGEETTARVSVVGATAAPSGPVEIHAGGKVVATGELTADGRTATASISLPRDLAAGAHRLTAVFPGSGDVTGSTSGAASYVVLPALARVDLDATSRVPRGSSPEVSISVLARGGAPAPTGTVTVTSGFRVIDRVALDADGTVEVQLPPVRLLTVVTALYGGDAGYLPGIDAATITAR